MSETALFLFNIGRVIFAVANFWLMYSFLVPKRSVWFQTIAIAGTVGAHFILRSILYPMGFDPFLVGYVLSLLYLVPIALIFKETIHSKIFIVFMVLSLSQFNFLFFLFIEQLLFGHIVGGFILLGQFLELFSIPFIRRYVAPHIKNILDIIDRRNFVFVLFPFFSYLLLASYGIQRKYILSVFIPLLLSTIVIFFAYYLIAISIEQTKRQRQLELNARIDSLTGLYNRRYVEQKIQEEFKEYQSSGTEFSLLLVDVDLFKNINDTCGHAGGDFLLKAVSEDLNKSVRTYDTVARWGGDEFLLVLPATNKENAVHLAERIRSTVENQQYVYENEMIAVTLTLGVYAIRHDDDTVDSIIEKADRLMYQGKRAGRNCIIFADRLNE